MAQHDQMRAGERRAGWRVIEAGPDGADVARDVVSIRVWPARLGWRLDVQYGPVRRRQRFLYRDGARAAFDVARKAAVAWQAAVGRATWAERDRVEGAAG